MPPAQPPRTAYVAAYLVVLACVTRVAAQIIADRTVGGSSLFDASPAVGAVLTAGAVLAGTLLPLALVHSWGRMWPGWLRPLAGRRVPRWLVLAPGGFIAVAMTVYFGTTLTRLLLEGSPTAEPYPAAFWWVTAPAYFVWGTGLCIAAASYWVITRPPCRICGLGHHGAPPTACARTEVLAWKPATPPGATGRHAVHPDPGTADRHGADRG